MPPVDELPEIWRLPLRSGKPGVIYEDAINHCLQRQIVAVGWGISSGHGDLQEVLRRIESEHDRIGLTTVRRFADAPIGSLVWTLHTDGTYRIGEIDGEWHYDESREAA